MLNWLRNRLSPVKRDTPRWKELAEALETLWQDAFDPAFNKLANLRSIYTADKAGQLRKIEEYGGYYEQDMPEQSMPIYLSMRKLEMLQKETDIPIQSTINRLGIFGVQWIPLFALVADGEYGTKFYDGITEAVPDGSYLTSRGKLLVDQVFVTDIAIMPKLEQQVTELLPLHIVFDGVLFVAAISGDVFIAASLQSSEITTVYPE